MCNKNSKNLFDCYTTTAQLVHQKKKQKKLHMSAILLGWMHTRNGSTKAKDFKRIKILFDTGCDASLVNRKFVQKLKTKTHTPSNWNTKGGSFKTN